MEIFTRVTGIKARCEQWIEVHVWGGYTNSREVRLPDTGYVLLRYHPSPLSVCSPFSTPTRTRTSTPGPPLPLVRVILCPLSLSMEPNSLALAVHRCGI